MKITDVQVVHFRTKTRSHPTRWGYSVWGEERDTVSGIIGIMPDEVVSTHS